MFCFSYSGKCRKKLESYHNFTDQFVLFALFSTTVRIPIFLVIEAYIGREISIAYRESHAKSHAVALSVRQFQLGGAIIKSAFTRGMILHIVVASEIGDALNK